MDLELDTAQENLSAANFKLFTANETAADVCKHFYFVYLSITFIRAIRSGIII